MIIGNPDVFALESDITQAYKELGLRALGFFLIHVGGRCYGRRSPDSTMLANAFDEAKERLAARGRHVAPFSEADAGEIANAVLSAIYADRQEADYFGLSPDDFRKIIQAPKGGGLWYVQ